MSIRSLHPLSLAILFAASTMLALAVMLVCAFPRPAHAATTPSPHPPHQEEPPSERHSFTRTRAVTIEHIASYGDMIHTVVSSGTLAYLGEGGSLVVLDMSDPDNPVRISDKLLSSTSSAYHIHISASGIAYVSVGDEGVFLVDVTDPYNLALLGFYPTPDYAGEVATSETITGTYAFVSGHDWGIIVVDVSNPASPTRVTSYQTGGSVVGITHDPTDPLIYVADTDTGLHILDVSDPTDPHRVGTYPFQHPMAYFQHIQVEGDYAYVSAGPVGGLQIFNVSAPTRPALVGSYQPASGVDGIHIVGDLAYLAGWNRGLFIVDISTPSDPQYVSNYTTPGYAQDVRLIGDTVVVAAGPDGLHIVDVSTPLSPAHTGTYDWTEWFGSIERVDDVFFFNKFGRINMMNLQDPHKPVILETYGSQQETTGSSIQVVEDLLYASARDEFYILNIANPAQPILVGRFVTEQIIYSLNVVGDIAYVGVLKSLLLVNISDPQNPFLMGSYPVERTVHGTDVVGNLAFLANSYDDLLLLDVSTPENPTLVGRCEIKSGLLGVQVVEGIAFMAADTGNLKLVDVSNSAVPAIIGEYDPKEGSYRDNTLSVVDNLVFAANSRELRINDISNPAQPDVVASHRIQFGLSDLLVWDDMVYALGSAGQMHIFRYEVEPLPAEPLETVTINSPTTADIKHTLRLSATVNPASTLLPVTYTWEADEHPPVVHTANLVDFNTFVWDTPGTYAITVTATSADGTTTTSSTTIDMMYHRSAYLPLVRGGTE